MTSYHPASNGIVEPFHRQSKAALRASPNPSAWTEFLPIILLCCHATVKADFDYSATEFHFDTTLALPGTMLEPTIANCTDPMSYISRLHSYFAELPNLSPRSQSISSHIPDDIETWTPEFVRNDAVRSPLMYLIEYPLTPSLGHRRHLNWMSTVYQKLFLSIVSKMRTLRMALELNHVTCTNL